MGNTSFLKNKYISSQFPSDPSCVTKTQKQQTQQFLKTERLPINVFFFRLAHI
jgi:hypothetical protein